MRGEIDHRPWGMYEVLEEEAEYKVKKIAVNPGHRLSLQSHEHRVEYWVIVAGSAVVTRDDEDIPLRAGQSIIIPKGARHRIANSGEAPLVFIEVQQGSYLGEDDITRYQDDYQRAG